MDWKFKVGDKVVTRLGEGEVISLPITARDGPEPRYAVAIEGRKNNQVPSSPNYGKHMRYFHEQSLTLLDDFSVEEQDRIEMESELPITPLHSFTHKEDYTKPEILFFQTVEEVQTVWVDEEGVGWIDPKKFENEQTLKTWLACHNCQAEQDDTSAIIQN